MSPQKINRVSAALLLAGFTAALLVYALAPPADEDAWRDDPLGRKRYQRELQVIGGKANQLSADFIDWFEGLWFGRSLAGTIAVLTLVATGAFRFVAVRQAPPPHGGTRPPPPRDL